VHEIQLSQRLTNATSLSRVADGVLMNHNNTWTVQKTGFLLLHVFTVLPLKARG